MKEKFLTGRVAMVTGGASGMGRAMALAFAEAGAHVGIGSLLQQSTSTKADGELVNRPGQEELDRTKGEIEALGVTCVAVDLDVCDVDSVKNFHKVVVDTLGPVDILANAAGITAEHLTVDHPEALWLKVMDVNTNGTFRATREVLPGMVERGWGRIVNIASTAASVGAPMSPAYCASKAAVVGFTKAVAQEGAPAMVTANTISPGWVETTFGREWLTDIAEKQMHKKGDEFIDEQKAENPQKRLIQPKEIGAMAAHLCRDEAVGITGQDITISAGSMW
ncbi:MAG TPA: SDR family NAD(P)-dependent oxidoreductase [Alkalispirochaeta sp.]|nr:SDR family NAD(P)-dependent oxidoreductase [Alkalispirochaeta sp.]